MKRKLIGDGDNEHKLRKLWDQMTEDMYILMEILDSSWKVADQLVMRCINRFGRVCSIEGGHEDDEAQTESGEAGTDSDAASESESDTP